MLTVQPSRPESASPSANCSGPATADFCSQSLTVLFPPGATSGSVNITVFDDSSPEGLETFEVMLVSPVNAVIKQSRSSATVTISDPEDCKFLLLSLTQEIISEIIMCMSRRILCILELL